MDSNAFSGFSKFLVDLLDDGQSPTGGQSKSSSWLVQNDDLGSSPEYDVELARGMVNRYVQAGFDPRYAVGMAANGVVESGLDPTAYNADEEAIGLFQHRPVGGRSKNLREFVDSTGRRMDDIYAHVDFSMAEKFAAERGSVRKIYNQNPETAQDFAAAIDKYYERSDGSARSYRKHLASDMYRRFYGDKRPKNIIMPTEDQVMNFLANGPQAPAQEQEANPISAFLTQVSSSMPDNPALAYAQADQQDSPITAGPPGEPTLAELNAEQSGIPPQQPAQSSTPPQGDSSPLARLLGGPFNPLIDGVRASLDTYKSVTGGGSATSPASAPMQPVQRREGETVYDAAQRNLGIKPPNTQLNLPGVPRQRETFGEADSISNEFRRLWVRDEGESDQEVRDRRRSVLLTAAEALQSISLGKMADYNTPSQMRLDERQRRFSNKMASAQESRMQETLRSTVAQQDFNNRLGMVTENRLVEGQDFNQRLAVRQENRMNRAQTLAESQFAFDQATKQIELSNDASARNALAGWAKENGFENLVPLIEGGGADTAGQIIMEELKRKTSATTGPSSFSLTDAAVESTVRRADKAGLDEAAAVIANWKDNPRAAEEVFKKVWQTDVPTDELSKAEKAEVYLDTLPDYIDEDTKDTFRPMAEQAVDRPQLLEELFTDMREAIQNDPRTKVLDTLFNAANDEYTKARTGASELQAAANQALELGTNPAFKPNQLKGDVLIPIARYLNGIPGVGEVFKDVADVTDTEIYSSRLLEAIRNGNLGNLAEGITGQLSNLEGQLLRDVLASGSVERVELMALSQLMRKRASRASVAYSAATEYQELARDGELPVNAQAEKEYIDQRVREEMGSTFERFPSIEDAKEYRMAKLEEYAKARDMSLEEFMQQDATKMPVELLGEVIIAPGPGGQLQLMPLFFEQYKD